MSSVQGRAAEELRTCVCRACWDYLLVVIGFLYDRQTTLAEEAEALLALHQEGCRFHRYTPHQ